MSEISVGFKLFADASALERGVVQARKSMRDLDKETQLFNKTASFLRGGLGGGLVIKAFSSAINDAQRLRDAAKQTGSYVDSSTDALARYGDTLDQIWEAPKKFFQGVLGGLNRFGEAVGEAVGNGVSLGDAFERNNRLRESEISLARTLKTIDEARAAYFKSANEDLEKQAKIRERIMKLVQQAGDLEDKNWMENLSSAQKMRFFEQLRDTSRALLNDPKASAEQQAGARIAIQNAQAEINRITTQDIEDKNAVAELRRQEKREQKELAKDRVGAVQQVTDDSNALTDRSKLSLAELAAISPFAVGVDSKLSESGGRAREAFDLEKQAEGRRLAGDFAGSEQLRGRAGEIRSSLVESGVLKSTDGDPSVPLKKALKVSEDHLQNLNNKIAGVAE